MNTRQLGLEETKSSECPFQGFLDPEDNHCFSFDSSKDNYEVLSENHPQLPQWLADVGHIGFNDISAKPIPTFDFPSFIPVIRHGSHKIMDGIEHPFVAVTLGDILNSSLAPIDTDIRKRFGISQTSKIILLCYGRDALIEKIWGMKKTIFSQITFLGFDLIVSVNYSIWLNQPHAERLVNLKRSLITFEDFLNLNVPAVPNMYWYGKTDLNRWAEWIRKNHNIKYIAINLQTERSRTLWEQTLQDLQYFVSNLDRPIHFLVTGPSTPKRIEQLKQVFTNFSLLNGRCARNAASSQLIVEENHKVIARYTSSPKNETMRKNMIFYIKSMTNHIPNSAVVT